jgi:hypothetical protein
LKKVLKLILLFFAISFLTACHKADQGNDAKASSVTTGESPNSLEYDSDDDEYEPTDSLSQDSDSLGH